MPNLEKAKTSLRTKVRCKIIEFARESSLHSKIGIKFCARKSVKSKS